MWNSEPIYSLEVNSAIQFLVFVGYKTKMMEDCLFLNTDVNLLDSGLSYYCLGTDYRNEDPVRLEMFVR